MSTPLSVLLLEDRVEDAELIMAELRAAEFASVWHRVESEPEFLARLQPAPDLILADYSVPEFDALRALERIQALGLDIPFIVVTGTLDDAAAVECIKQGAADYLLKDRLNRLGPAVERALREQRGRVARREAEGALAAQARSLAALVAQRDAILDQMPSGLIVVDATGQLVLINEEGRRISGMPPHTTLAVQEQATQYEIRDVATGQAIPPHETPLGRALGGELVTRAEYFFRRPGEVEDVWAGATATPMRDTDGQITGALAIFSDITEQRRLERAEANSERRYQRLYQAVACGIIVRTATGIVVDANRAAAEILGGSLAELNEEVWSPALRDSTREDGLPFPVAERPSAVVQRTGQPVYGTVLSSRRPDGERRWLQVDAVPVPGPSGEPDHIVTSFIDITARKTAETQARQAHAEKLTLLDWTIDGIFGIDRQGRCTSINRAGAAMLGYAPEALLDQPLHAMIHAGRAESRPCPLAACPITRSLQTQETVRVADESFWCQDGRCLPVEYSAAPVFADGALQGVVVAFRDLSERQLAEAALRESNARLESALGDLCRSEQHNIQQERLHALGEMASGIAHDFNNALAPILGYSELLLARPALWEDQATVRDYLTLINTGAQDAASVVRRLREFARSRAPDEGVQPIQLDVLVAEVVALTQPRWKDQALSQGQAISVQADLEPVPPIRGTAADLREALTNLIFNAVDALPQGGTITLRTRAEASYVRLEVSDTGSGMSDEVRQRCLEPFFSTKGERGTGLGLAMVYGIVQRHEGRLEIESAPGQGTTFRLRLPLVTEPEATVSAAEATGPAPPQRVLVVDDEATVRDILIAYLRFDGHTVDAASAGAEGLEQFRAGGYDLVITDYAMPGLTGEHLALAIKEHSPTTPVIMMTGFGAQLRDNGTSVPGVDCVVSKPATLAELRRAVAQVTNAAESAPRPPAGLTVA